MKFNYWQAKHQVVEFYITIFLSGTNIIYEFKDVPIYYIILFAFLYYLLFNSYN